MTQIGHDLGQGVVGDRDLGPQCLHDVVLGDECSRMGDEQEEEVQRLRRELDRGALAEEAVADGIETEGAEAIGNSRD